MSETPTTEMEARTEAEASGAERAVAVEYSEALKRSDEAVKRFAREGAKSADAEHRRDAVLRDVLEHRLFWVAEGAERFTEVATSAKSLDAVPLDAKGSTQAFRHWLDVNLGIGTASAYLRLKRYGLAEAAGTDVFIASGLSLATVRTLCEGPEARIEFANPWTVANPEAVHAYIGQLADGRTAAIESGALKADKPVSAGMLPALESVGEAADVLTADEVKATLKGQPAEPVSVGWQAVAADTFERLCAAVERTHKGASDKAEATGTRKGIERFAAWLAECGEAESAYAAAEKLAEATEAEAKARKAEANTGEAA